MTDEPQELRRISWAECFGFTQLFRAFRLAIHPTKLLLALFGILATYGTGRVLDAVWPTSYRPAAAAASGEAVSELSYFLTAEGGARQATVEWLQTRDLSKPEQRTGVFKLLLDHGRDSIRLTTDAVMAADVRGLVGAAWFCVMGIVWLFAMHPVYGILFFIVSLVIWAFFGGAVCRVAALHAARDERIGLMEALAFAKQKFLSFFAAPLMPVGILILLAVPLVLGGLVGWIGGIGEILAGILFFLALCAGFAIAFVTIGALAGFSLTFPTIAVEGSDAFDALSRSFSYVYQRPWRTAFYALVSLVYGAICLVFVKFFVRLGLYAVSLFVGLFMNLGSPYLAEGADQATRDLGKLDAMWQAPSLIGGSPFWGSFPDVDMAHASAFGHCWFYLWIFLVVGVVGAFIVSFYYSASTLIYFLLRRGVDAADLEDVYIEEQPEDTAPVTESPAAPEGEETGGVLPPEAEPSS
ncbi:MAG: hypothetical protein JXQ75_23255 [Phycisphaerae bacterium]|nr:hypothetical protein [Phycisphaerae bacterium]